MPTRKPIEVLRSTDAREYDIRKFEQEKAKAENEQRKIAYQKSPEGKINAAARLVLQRRTYMETSGTIPSHKLYQIFYTDTINSIEKNFNELVIPTINERLQAKIDEAVEKQFRKIPKSKVEGVIQSIITKLKETGIVKTSEDEEEQREILIKKIKSNIARELPKDKIQKVKSKIVDELLTTFSNNYRPHIELLDKFDLVQNTMHRDSAKNYVNQLFEFLQTLTSEYDLTKYFATIKIKSEGYNNDN